MNCTFGELTGSGEKEDRSGCVTFPRHILHGFNHEFSDVRVDTVQIVLETTKAWFNLGITWWHDDMKIEDLIIVHYTYEALLHQRRFLQQAMAAATDLTSVALTMSRRCSRTALHGQSTGDVLVPGGKVNYAWEL